MSEDIYEFEDDLYIDLNRLEWEAARQAQLFGKWSKRWAHAAKVRDRAHERVKTKRSELVLFLKENFRSEGYTKEPTAGQYEAFYRVNEEYKLLKKAFIDAQSEVNHLYSAMRSFEHKKEMLAVEQRLYAQDYFGVPYEVTEYQEKIQKEMEESQTLQPTDRIPKRLVRRK
jgi:hypothetical protein